MKQQPKIIVPNNNKYTRHLKLTEKQEQELIAYNKAGAEYFKKAFQHRGKHPTIPSITYLENAR